MGKKAETTYYDNFFWVLGGIPHPGNNDFEYYIIPSGIMAKNIREVHVMWLNSPGKKGQAHNPNDLRAVLLPPQKNINGWGISDYLNRWDLIEEKLITKNLFNHSNPLNS